MDLKDYTRFDGLGLADLVQRGEVSAAELAQTGLEAIARVNPQVNAVIESYADAPAKAAPAKDAPFAGVPFLIKDIGSHDAGGLCELGSRLTKGMQAPPFASELVNRFRAAGVTVLGRSNIPEFGSSCTTEPVLHGPTRNPWNLERTSGGSSGGAAAAVASGMVPIAHANDAGGSIRWPAACCGLVGLKPSRNLNPVGPDSALALHGLACEHIVSRSVRDTAAMLDATAGPDAGAWCYTPRLDGSYLEQSRRAPGRLRIALDLDPRFPPTTLEPEVITAIHDTAKLCEDMGHIVEEARLEFDHEAMLRAFATIWSTDLRAGVEMLSRMTGRPIGLDTLEPHVYAAWRDTASVSGTDFIGALAQMNSVARAYGRLFTQYDVMLTPAGRMAPFELGRIGKIPTDTFFEWFVGMCEHCPFLSTVNIAGIPGLSLPLGWSADGLPIGSHFVAPQGHELRLLQLATQLETARPWADRRAPVHAAN
ncbi:MAG: amidase [Novosphingobium sp.]|nr:amidase [Novosphingobium sp.]